MQSSKSKSDKLFFPVSLIVLLTHFSKMSMQRTIEFRELYLKIDSIQHAPVHFSTLGAREHRDKMRVANDVLPALLFKTVRQNREYQAGWLLSHIMRLFTLKIFVCL